MDNTREKLIDIINNFFGCDAAYYDVNPFDLATHLIANGVTLDNQVSSSKWISVKDRLPNEEYDWVLAQITLKPSCIYGVPVVAELRADGWYDAYDNMIDGKYEKVTHWMPLPQPPKGE